MYAWYKASSICVAYLEDVGSTSDALQEPLDEIPGRRRPSRCYWRGWTLQELVAPTQVDFYNRSQKKIGSKCGLRREVADITGIGEVDLIFFDRSRASIAQKMSWASRRVTTITEDIAYCLSWYLWHSYAVTVPRRTERLSTLARGAYETSTDHTIFAWDRTRRGDNLSRTSSLHLPLSSSPVAQLLAYGPRRGPVRPRLQLRSSLHSETGFPIGTMLSQMPV